MELRSRNTNTLQDAAYRLVLEHGISRSSRNGPVLMVREPVSICLTHPYERVNFCPVRDANPFFHLWESLAMLGGVNSVSLMSFFAKNMLSFSDDGVRYNAFYGDRARVKWGDQISWVIDELARNPDSRQCVVNLWDTSDWLKSTKDKACNLMMLFSVIEGELCMTTYNRSNDAVWGSVSGANVVHLSFFQEYVALALTLPMGPWWHVANNFHVYCERPDWKKLSEHSQKNTEIADYPGSHCLFYQKDRFDKDLQVFLDLAQAIARNPTAIIETNTEQEPFLVNTAVPVFNTWVLHKNSMTDSALKTAETIAAPDWRQACVGWLQRRIDKANRTKTQELLDSAQSRIQ